MTHNINTAALKQFKDFQFVDVKEPVVHLYTVCITFSNIHCENGSNMSIRRKVCAESEAIHDALEEISFCTKHLGYKVHSTMIVNVA